MTAPPQSVELVPDAAGDAAVRAQWDALVAAGLPSLARHRSASNRPHVTVVTAPLVDPAQDEALEAALPPLLPITVRWGAVTIFGPGPHAVVRLVEVAPPLARLNALAASIIGVPADNLTAPGRWSPHLTLARRVCAADLDAVLAVLAAWPQEDVTFVAARRWDPATRQEWALGDGGRPALPAADGGHPTPVSPPSAGPLRGSGTLRGPGPPRG